MPVAVNSDRRGLCWFDGGWCGGGKLCISVVELPGLLMNSRDSMASCSCADFWLGVRSMESIAGSLVGVCGDVMLD